MDWSGNDSRCGLRHPANDAPASQTSEKISMQLFRNAAALSLALAIASCAALVCDKAVEKKVLALPSY